MNKEFFASLQLIEKEKGIPKEYMIERIEAALISAFKKEYGSTANARIHIDPVKEDLKVFQQKEVVEVVEDPVAQISLEDAKAISKRNTLGKIVEFEVKLKNFRRLSAGAGKSVLIQGIREGEHKAMQEAYVQRIPGLLYHVQLTPSPFAAGSSVAWTSEWVRVWGVDLC